MGCVVGGVFLHLVGFKGEGGFALGLVSGFRFFFLSIHFVYFLCI
jgi:hypothetical protein